LEIRIDRAIEIAIFRQQLKPKERFVSFLQRNAHFGVKLGIASRPGTFPDTCRYGGAGSQELMPESFDFFSPTRKARIKTHDPRGIALRPLTKLGVHAHKYKF